MTVIEFYDQNIKPLSIADRISLARMILNDIPPQAVVDVQDSWSDTDLAEFSAQNWRLTEEESDRASGR